MSRRHLLLSSLLAAVLAATSLHVAADGHDWKKIRIAIEGAYPPFSEIGPDGKLKGFDVDIALALCTQMKAECTLVQQSWDGMIPSLQARKFDAILSEMSTTPERLKQVAFSGKYINTPPAVFGRATMAHDISPAALKGKKVGVQRSTTHDRWATTVLKDSEIVRYTSQDDVFLDLAAGRLDAVVCDQVAGDLGFLKKPAGKGFAVIGNPPNDPAIFGPGAGVAVRKADADLAQKFSAAIAAIRADGTYQKVQARYFTFDVYGK